MPATVVLVTGCSEGGLGYALCQEFSSRGCRVYAGVRRVESAQDLIPLGVTILELDVNDAKSRQEAVATVLSKEGRLDILVNNAGIQYRCPMADMPPDKMKALFDTNLFSPIYLSQLVIPHMARQGSGLILNISSVSGYVWLPFSGPYAASKAALTAVSNTMRLELQPLGIRVMHVALGAVHTNIFSKSAAMVDESWPSQSMYNSIKPLCLALVNSLVATAVPVRAAAQRIAAAALLPAPPPCLWTAGQSSFVWWLTWLPSWVVDGVIKRRLKMSTWKLKLPGAQE